MRFVSRYKAQRLGDRIREEGYGATVAWGSGQKGSVGIVSATVRRQEVTAVCCLAEDVDPEAFVTVEEARAVRRSYMHMVQREK